MEWCVCIWVCMQWWLGVCISMWTVCMLIQVVCMHREWCVHRKMKWRVCIVWLARSFWESSGLLWQGLLSWFHLMKLDGSTAWLCSPLLLPCSSHWGLFPPLSASCWGDCLSLPLRKLRSPLLFSGLFCPSGTGVASFGCKCLVKHTASSNLVPRGRHFDGWHHMHTHTHTLSTHLDSTISAVLSYLLISYGCASSLLSTSLHSWGWSSHMQTGACSLNSYCAICNIHYVYTYLSEILVYCIS